MQPKAGLLVRQACREMKRAEDLRNSKHRAVWFRQHVRFVKTCEALAIGIASTGAGGQSHSYRDGVPAAAMVAGQVTFFVKLDPATEWQAHAPCGSDGKVVSSPPMSPCTRPSQILSRLLS